MSHLARKLSAVSGFLHQYLLVLIILSYALAAWLPGPGLWMKEADALELAGGFDSLTLSIPKLLLWFLLFNAGLRVRAQRIGEVARRPRIMLAGLAANVAVPLGFLALMVPTLQLWHNPNEAAVVLIGLALVSSMPIAGSSTGWSQAADGDMALSLGLVLGSTFLSPLTTPFSLHALGLLASAPYGASLHQLAGSETGTFLLGWVLIPSALGIVVRSRLTDSQVAACEPFLKVVVPLNLLLLCYINASTCLPEALGHPDWDFLGIIFVFVLSLCTLTFAAGHLTGKAMGADSQQRTALIFGLGMNNNGTGLVLASMAMGSQPLVMLPIIVYNLVQHLVAGGVNAWLRHSQAKGD